MVAVGVVVVGVATVGAAAAVVDGAVVAIAENFVDVVGVVIEVVSELKVEELGYQQNSMEAQSYWYSFDDSAHVREVAVGVVTRYSDVAAAYELGYQEMLAIHNENEGTMVAERI